MSRVVCRASTLDIQETLLGTCDERGEDRAEVVRARVLHVQDLPGADAIYHYVCICSTNFRKKMEMPKQFLSDMSDQARSKKRKIGRPQDKEASEAFLKVINYLQENDDEELTISDSIRKMLEFLGDSADNVCQPLHERQS